MTTLCSGRGLWFVFATVPVYQPPIVKWNWNNGGEWNEREGDDYTVEIQENYDPNVYYRVTVQGYGKQAICGYESSTDVRIYTENLRGGWSWIIGDPEPSYRDGQITGYYRQVWLRRADGSRLNASGSSADYWVISGCKNPTGSDNYYGVGYSMPQIISVTRLDGLPVEKQYTLTIRRNGTTVFSETRNTSPTVEKIPESCNYPSQENLIYSEINLDKNAFLKAEDLNSLNVIIKRCVGQIQNDQISSTCETVATVEGTCARPRIRAKEEPLCPNGTCEIECGGCICCYDNLGYAVKSYCGGIV